MKRWVIVIAMTGLLFGQGFFLGFNDIITLLFLITITVLLFIILNRLQLLSKRTLRTVAKKDSWLYDFLSRDNSIFIKFWIIILALTFAMTIAILLKGLFIHHGYVAPLLVIFIGSAILYNFINKDFKSTTVENNIHEDIARHGHEMTRIFFAAIIINVLLALTISSKETYIFLSNEINIRNFDIYAYENQIDKTENNIVSRAFVNFYILANAAKVAIITKVVNEYEFLKSYYFFYLISILFNFFKLTVFSWSIVLLQRSLDRRADTATYYITQIRDKFRDKFSKKQVNT